MDYLVTHKGPHSGFIFIKEIVTEMSAQAAADRIRRAYPQCTIGRIYLLTDMQGEWK